MSLVRGQKGVLLEINIYIGTVKRPDKGVARVFGYGVILEIDGEKRLLYEVGYGKGESYMGVKGTLDTLRLLRRTVPRGRLKVSVYTTNQTVRAILDGKKMCDWKGKHVPALWKEIFPLIDEMDLEVYRVKRRKREGYLQKGFEETQKRNPMTFEQYSHADKILRYADKRCAEECSLLVKKTRNLREAG